MRNRRDPAVAVVNLSIAGIFIGIIWHYTRNLWLILIIHALLICSPILEVCEGVYNI
jgi:membrane protease YdiL (CAAX protease family)